MSCLGCTKRYVGCHSKCKEYEQMKKEIEEKNDKIRKQKQLDNILKGYRKEKTKPIGHSLYKK